MVHFRRGEEVRVIGTIVRLDVRVPLRVILNEQRHLRERPGGPAW